MAKPLRPEDQVALPSCGCFMVPDGIHGHPAAYGDCSPGAWAY